MQIIETIVILALMFILADYMLYMLQEHSPESLPPMLRKKEGEIKIMKTFETTIFYEGAFGIKTHKERMTANSLEKMEFVVLDELNKKKFISLGNGVLVPTNSIAEVQIKELVIENW